MIGAVPAADMRAMRNERNKIFGYAPGTGMFSSQNIRPGITRSSSLATKFDFQSIVREGTPEEKSKAMSDMWNGYHLYKNEDGSRPELAGGIGTLDTMHPAQKVIITAICKGIPVDPDKYAFLVAMALQPGKMWFSGAMGAASSEIIAMTCSRYDAVFDAQENSEAQIAYPTTVWVKYGAKKKSLRYGIPLDKMLLYANRAVDIIVSTFIRSLVDAIVKTTCDFLYDHATPVGVEEMYGQSYLPYVGSGSNPQLFMSAFNECTTATQSPRNMVIWPFQSRIQPPGPTVDISHFDELVPEGGIMPYTASIGPAMNPMRSTVVNGHYIMPVSDDRRVVTWWTVKRTFDADFQGGNYKFEGHSLDCLFPELESTTDYWAGEYDTWKTTRFVQYGKSAGLPCMWRPQLPKSMYKVWKKHVDERGYLFSRGDINKSVGADGAPQVSFMTQGDFVHGAGVSAEYMGEVFKRLKDFKSVVPQSAAEAFTCVLSAGESMYPRPKTSDNKTVKPEYNNWMGKGDIGENGDGHYSSIIDAIRGTEIKIGDHKVHLSHVLRPQESLDQVINKAREGAEPDEVRTESEEGDDTTTRKAFDEDEFLEKLSGDIDGVICKQQIEAFKKLCKNLRTFRNVTIHPPETSATDKTIHRHFWAGFWKSADEVRTVWDKILAASRHHGEADTMVELTGFQTGALFTTLETFFESRSFSMEIHGMNVCLQMKPVHWRELLDTFLRALSVLYGQGALNDRDQAALMAFMYWPWVKRFAHDVVKRNGIFPFATALLLRRELETSSLLAFTSNYGHPAAPATMYTELNGSPFYATWGNSEAVSELQNPSEAMIKKWSKMIGLAPNTRESNYNMVVTGGAINIAQLPGITEPAAMVVGGVVIGDRRARPLEAADPKDVFIPGRIGANNEFPASACFVFGMPGEEFSRRPLIALHEKDEDTAKMLKQPTAYVEFHVNETPNEYIWPAAYVNPAREANNGEVEFTPDDSTYHKSSDENMGTFKLKPNFVLCWDDPKSGKTHGFAERRADVYANQCVFNVRRPNDVLDEARRHGDGPLNDHAGSGGRTFVISHKPSATQGPIIPPGGQEGPIGWLNSIPYAPYGSGV